MTHTTTLDMDGVTIETELNDIGDIEVIVIDHRQPRDHKYVMNVQYTDNDDGLPSVRILASTATVRILRAIKAYIAPDHKE